MNHHKPDPSSMLDRALHDFQAAFSQKPAESPQEAVLSEAMPHGTDNAQNPEPPSPTALRLDRWSIKRGKEWVQDQQVSDALSLAGDRMEHIAADFLAAAWEPRPELAKKSMDARLHHFIESLMQTPEYEKLHRITRLDDITSEMAALSFARQWFDMTEQDEPEDELDRDSQALQAATQACKQAKEEVDSAEATRKALGIGKGGESESSLSASEIKELFEQVRDNNSLRRIMELAGKYRRLSQSMQRNKVTHGHDEVVGIEFGNDLSRIVPSELLMLADDDLELEFFRRFAENALMLRDMRSTASEVSGPIVIIVDESGSMNGERIAHAKAMALSILWVAEHQKRWACLVGFAEEDHCNILTVPPGKRDISALLQWLEHFYAQGTSPVVPLVTVPNKWNELGCPKGRTDIITITDARLDVSAEMAQRYNAWRAAEQVKTNTIVIGDNIGDMEGVSDRWWSIDELNLESDGVSACLSI